MSIQTVSDIPVVAARATGITSAGLTSMTWIANLNEILQLGATTAALVSGIFAGWWYYENAKQKRRENKANRPKRNVNHD